MRATSKGLHSGKAFHFCIASVVVKKRASKRAKLKTRREQIIPFFAPLYTSSGTIHRFVFFLNPLQ